MTTLNTCGFKGSCYHAFGEIRHESNAQRLQAILVYASTVEQQEAIQLRDTKDNYRIEKIAYRNLEIGYHKLEYKMNFHQVIVSLTLASLVLVVMVKAAATGIDYTQHAFASKQSNPPPDANEVWSDLVSRYPNLVKSLDSNGGNDKVDLSMDGLSQKYADLFKSQVGVGDHGKDLTLDALAKKYLAANSGDDEKKDGSTDA